ncbi:MAG TPA: hypothetical protein VFU81_03530 [Thermomicrobiales bacterium]|nr:hypothetical protein [Thermomicrobiales bacterium]
MLLLPAAGVASMRQHREDTPMYPDDPTSERRTLAARQATLLDTIQDCRFLAGYKLAADDARERAIADVVLARRLAASGSTPRRVPILRRMRQFGGEALVRLGMMLRGGSGAGAMPNTKAIPSLD